MAAIFQLRRGSGSISLADGELYLNKTTQSLQLGSGTNTITLAKMNEENIGSFLLTGDVKLSGSIFLGNESSDNISALGVFNTNLVPSGQRDVGTTSAPWTNVYANNISASSITGSIEGVGNLQDFSASLDERFDIIEATSSLYNNAMSGSLRLYVSPEGSDTNDGTQPHKPFKTIKAAVESLGSAVYTNTKRYTIIVGSGNYTEQHPIAVPPGVAIVGDTLRTIRLTAANPTKDFFHCHDSNYFYGLRFLDLKHPAFAFSFPASTATSTISGGGISTISVVHSLSGYTDGTNQDLGIIIEGPDASGSIATATANVVGGVITQINVVNAGTNYSANEKPHISIPAPVAQRPVITTSPYVQNCSSITGPFNTSGVKVLQALPYDEATFNIDEQGAGGGIRIDGNLVHPLSPLESFVADAFTQVNQGGPGHLVINKGYAQFVSCFTTFCTYGFKTANGGFANISNSVIDFGKYGLISKTYFPQTYNTGSSLETKTSTVSGFVIDENGAGYTGSVANVTISGGGASVQATAEATVNANGSIDEIVLLTGGSGYTSQPTVTIAAPTGVGGIQATTVANKASISGVSEMLMSLESGSRGVDISSNMILNGVDYLVTDVVEVSGQPNQRRITTYPSPPSILTGNTIYFHQLSNISTGGLVMEYVGSGVTYNALPKFGGVPIRTREINEFAPGRVFYSTVDNIGNLKIGDFFAVNQLTGEVTIDANSFNLSGLNAIGPFKRNGVAVGIQLTEVSNNTTLLNSQGVYGEDTAPTQYAVKEYIEVISSSVDSRLDNLQTTSASVNNSITYLNSHTQSLNTWTGSVFQPFSTSVDSRLDSLESSATSDDSRIDFLEAYSASLKTAFTASGQDLIIYGNLTVQGTQTSLNVNEVYVEDKTLTLASGSATSAAADGAGIQIAGANVTMSWDDANSRVNLNKSFYVSGDLSGSTLIGIGNVTTYSASVQSKIDAIQSATASFDSKWSTLSTTTASFSSSIGQLNAFTSSQISKNSTLELLTASYDSRWTALSTTTSSVSSSIFNLNAFTASEISKNSTLASLTGSYDSRWNTLSTTTASYDSRWTALSTTTSSFSSSIGQLNTFSSSQLTKDATLELVTASYDSRWSTLSTTTASVSSSIFNLNAFSASQLSKDATLQSVTSSLNSFTASASSSIGELFITASNHEGRIDYIESVAFGGIDLNSQFSALQNVTASLQQATASLNTFTSSAGNRLTNLESKSASVDVSITNLNTFTSSINTTIKSKLNADGVLSGSSQIQLGSAAGEITLGTQTTGNYIATITGDATNGLTVAGSGVENAPITLTLSQNITTSGNIRFNSIGVGMNASATAGRIDASNDVVAFSSSDMRFKNNVQPIQNALQKIEAVGGYEFDWDTALKSEHGYDGHDVGVIAQEIEKIAPELVTTRSNGYKAVKYEKIVPILIEAIKELSAKIKELENK